ncbi:MarR family transcriptional regulator [Streptomyces mobaraensis NBRC 13819 = DSM 40847]|uniref:Putative MarR family transcriptional regulator n=1 Tax=Streptomyces mobaraensis (strain ATCC 29032 / DSM 40847 / JCM 4168 / NBRC 13819 / NCIMB 11159 / IPCR 16-22) TaxID=1223523 RepID=M3ATJ2_STRM1|nr:MarR family transcriptional regulator [Streptomyces mobaraensis]EME96907.1 putative MarR family transcriptional regulator [Streptomyces mobaraensis NBRC 13819 = DSM 40847]QTT77437.1 MarR family transcriptional regulator [Streptomyces mobaraensis NBRC 13819 = DSM 40847]
MSAGERIGGPDHSPGFWLWHATLRWQRAIAETLAPYDLTHAQFVLLSCAWWLNERGELPSQQALARQAGTDVKMTSQLVRKLEAKGLLDREADPRDSRARRLRITPRGAELARAAITEVERVDAEFFAPAGEGVDGLDGRALSALLRRLVETSREERA